jgi:hypothetical protein
MKENRMSKSGAALRAAGWVTVGAVAAGGVATAATTTSGDSSSKSATTAATAPAPAPHKDGKRGGKHGGELGKLEGRLLHGQFVVLGKDKKPTTLAEQRGTVSAVSPTSISLTSTDGFKQTYVVNSDTKVRIDGKKSVIADVKAGQTATVLAGVSGSTETAKTIVERPAKAAN